MKLAVVVLAVLLPHPAWSEPKPERWEMLISVVDDNSKDRDEKIPNGNDKTTDRGHTDAKVSVILDAIPQAGGYTSIKMTSLAGGGTWETSHVRRFKTSELTSNQGETPHRTTTTIDEDFQSKGTLAPLKTTEQEMSFVVGDAIVVAGTLHFTTDYKNHSKKVIDSGGTPIVHEDNNASTQDATYSVSISMAEATKAMVTSHRFAATEIEKVTDKRLVDAGMKGTKTTIVEIHPLGKK